MRRKLVDERHDTATGNRVEAARLLRRLADMLELRRERERRARRRRGRRAELRGARRQGA